MVQSDPVFEVGMCSDLAWRRWIGFEVEHRALSVADEGVVGEPATTQLTARRGPHPAHISRHSRPLERMADRWLPHRGAVLKYGIAPSDRRRRRWPYGCRLCELGGEREPGHRFAASVDHVGL